MLDRARSSISAASAAALLAALAGCGEGAPSAGTASSASASMRAVTFKTSLLGEYVTAEGAGGGDVNANRAIAGTWETFMLYDLNGGDLNHGDLINLQTNNGHFVCAENGGGGIVDANRTAASTWETFRVLKLGGGDAVVRDGDAIALQTEIAGRYVSAIGGGGANVVADRTAIQSWETFLIGLPSSHAGPPAPVSAPPVAPPPSTAPPTRLRITSHCADPIWIAHSDNVGDPQNVQLASGQSYDYQIPSGGLASARFWPKIGCDATGHHCAIGDNGQGGGQPCPANGCQPPIDSKFEVTFAAAGASDQTWYNLSQVDGYTLPFKVAPSGAGVNQGTCVASDCSQLSLNGCPGAENLSGGGAYPAYAVEDLRVRDAGGRVIGCMSPCKKWNYPAPWGIGGSEGVDPGLHLCCPTPIDPATGQCTIANHCMTSPACSNAGDPLSVVHTDYVAAIRAMCPSAYSYAYDDAAGLHACPSDTAFEVTFCP
ncbi:MAG TPA: thaumatin family protein [Polyangia bacterium]|nr:thaumatin family protein [Polyangia bacterium]